MHRRPVPELALRERVLPVLAVALRVLALLVFVLLVPARASAHQQLRQVPRMPQVKREPVSGTRRLVRRRDREMPPRMLQAD